MQMLVLANSHERTMGKWQKLLKEFDPRLQFVEVFTLPGGGSSIIEFVFSENAQV